VISAKASEGIICKTPTANRNPDVPKLYMLFIGCWRLNEFLLVIHFEPNFFIPSTLRQLFEN
jgi:hypothetical protein